VTYGSPIQGILLILLWGGNQQRSAAKNWTSQTRPARNVAGGKQATTE